MASSESIPPQTITLRVLAQLPEPDDVRRYDSLQSDVTVGALKIRLSQELASKPAPSQIRLIHAGHPLTNDASSLQEVFGREAFVQNGTFTIHMIVRDNQTPSSRSGTSRAGTPTATQPPRTSIPQLGVGAAAGAGGVPLPPNVAIPNGLMPNGLMPNGPMPAGMGMPMPMQMPMQMQIPLPPAAAPFNPMFQPGFMNFPPQGPWVRTTPQMAMPPEGVNAVTTQDQNPESTAQNSSDLQNSQGRLAGEAQNAGGMQAPHAEVPPHMAGHPRANAIPSPNPAMMQQMHQQRVAAMMRLNQQRQNQANQNHQPAHSNSPSPQIQQNNATTDGPAARPGLSDQSESQATRTNNPSPRQENFMQPFQTPLPGVAGPAMPFANPTGPATQVREATGPNGERVQVVQSVFSGAIPFNFQGMPLQAQSHQQPAGDQQRSPSQSQPTVAYMLNSPSGPQALVYTHDGVFSSGPPSNVSRPTTTTYNNAAPSSSSSVPTSSSAPQPTIIRQQQQQAQQQLQQPERHQGEQRAAGAEEANGDILTLLGVVFRHVWLLVRIFGLIWLLTRGASNRRTLLIVLFTSVFLLVQAGVFGERPIERLRAQLERAATDRVHAGAGRADGQGANDNQAVARPSGGDPAGSQRGEQNSSNPPRGANQGTQRDSGWLWERFGGIERAFTLFLASLWPGVGERQIVAQERVEREAREAQEQEQARRREEAEGQPERQGPRIFRAGADGNWHEAGRTVGRDRGRSSAVEDQQNDDGVRERRAPTDGAQA
ncbi:MAG: hypothetical protein Q9159_006252 [Coniocarpon cinnabarinum]